MLRVTRQVQIEAKVVEVELRDEFSAGIDWRAVLGGLTPNPTSSPTTTQVSSGGMTLTLNVTDFSALLKALAAQGDVNVLSSPRIIAMNNEPTVMRAATQDAHSMTESIVLSLTAQISADGIIHMNVNPSVTRTGLATVATRRSGATHHGARGRHAGPRAAGRDHRHCRVDARAHRSAED
jgi:type II secretory pathway component GspD/PulD (secretin)